MDKPLKVWVLLYSHRHGNDVFAFETEALAIKGAASIIEMYLPDLRDAVTRTKIGKALDEDKWSEAIAIWSEYQNEESFMGEDFEFHELDVQGP